MNQHPISSVEGYSMPASIKLNPALEIARTHQMTSLREISGLVCWSVAIAVINS